MVENADNGYGLKDNQKHLLHPHALVDHTELFDATHACKSAVLFLAEVQRLLLEKNRKYGDSAANPSRIFSKTDAAEQIRVRIDDKLSRIRTMGDATQQDEDTVKDLVGYLALLVGVGR